MQPGPPVTGIHCVRLLLFLGGFHYLFSSSLLFFCILSLCVLSLPLRLPLFSPPPVYTHTHSHSFILVCPLEYSVHLFRYK